MANGFIRIPRTFYETDFWNPGPEFTPLEAFLDLTRRINYDHKPVTRLIGGRHITYGRDEVCLSISYLVKAWNWTTGRVRTFLKRLEDAHLIQIKRSGKGHINTICFLFSDKDLTTGPQEEPGSQRNDKPERMPDSKPETGLTALNINGKAEEETARNDKLDSKPEGKPDDNKLKRIREIEKKKNSISSEEKKEKDGGGASRENVTGTGVPQSAGPAPGETARKTLPGLRPRAPLPAPTPSLAAIRAYCEQQGLRKVDPEKFYLYYASRGWRIGSSPIRCWQSVLHRWANAPLAAPPTDGAPSPSSAEALQRVLKAYKAGLKG